MNEDTYEEQIDNPLSLNLYTYVGNNLLIRKDPTGHDWLDKVSGFLNAISDELTGGLWTYAWDKVYTNRDEDYFKGYAFLTPQTTNQVYFALVISSGKGYVNLNKSAAQSLKVAQSQSVVNALSDFKSIHKIFGNKEILVDKSGMKHILERHTLKFWAGEAKVENTFFDSKMSVKDISNLLDRALNASSK